MMKEVFLIKSEFKSKAETVLKSDDEISRGSIQIKDPSSLDIDEEGVFIIVDLPENLIEKAEDLLKDFGEKYKDKEKVLEKIKEQEDSAIQGFGNILG